MNERGIVLKKVSKIIDNKYIVKDINFEVKKGEIFGLLGPNGAGKSTTIKMITGLSEVDQGEILICDKNLKNNHRVVSHIGAIVENPTFYDYLSGYANLKLYAKMFKGIKSKDIKNVANKMGLKNRINEKVSNYSLGMKQRLGIALAMVHNPDVLILDEPTNGLDPSGTISMRNYLKDLAQKHKVAILISSHLLNEMENICDKVGIMYEGKLLEVKEMYEKKNENSKFTYKVETNNNKLTRQLLDCYIDNSYKNKGNIYIKIPEKNSNDILELLISKKIKIYNFSLIKPTLEEYFINLINEKKGEVL